MKSTNTQLPFVLYHTRTCPFCYLVRHAIDDLELDIEMRDINDNPAYRAELISGGGKQQVPCLHILDPDGGTEWLYESRDIIEYLSHFKTSQQDAA